MFEDIEKLRVKGLNDVYYSLLYTYATRPTDEAEKAVNGYLDVWYGRVHDKHLVYTINREKEGYFFGNIDYQATQPALRLLCEKKSPYRGITDICEIQHIYDVEPYVAPVNLNQIYCIFFTLCLILSYTFKLNVIRISRSALEVLYGIGWHALHLPRVFFF